MGIQGAKPKKGNIKTPDPAIRVRILYESDPTLHLFIVRVINRNGESSLILSITIRTHKIYMYPINIRLRCL